MRSAATRRMSSAVFGNDKFVEIVLALASGSHATAQQLVDKTGINHDLVKRVLVRLESAGMVKAQARIGGVRGTLPYDVQDSPEWRALLALCTRLQSGT